MPMLEHPTEWPGAVKGTLARKVGPLPVWGWAAVVGGGITAVYLVSKGKIKLPAKAAAVTNPVATAVAGGFAGNYGSGGGSSSGSSAGGNPAPVTTGGTGTNAGGTSDGGAPGGIAAPIVDAGTPWAAPAFNLATGNVDTALAQGNYLGYVNALRDKSMTMPGSQLVVDTAGRANLLASGVAVPAGWQVQTVSMGGALIPTGQGATPATGSVGPYATDAALAAANPYWKG